MSGNRTDHDDMNDFPDFPDDLPMHTISSTSAEPHAHAQTHTVHVDDGYSDLSTDEVHQDHDGSADELEDAGVDSEEPKQKSLLSRAIIPASIAVLGLATLGTGWELGLFGGSDTPQQNTQQVAQQTAPVLPSRTLSTATTPTLPAQGSQVATLPTLPTQVPVTLPATQPVATLQPARSVTTAQPTGTDSLPRAGTIAAPTQAEMPEIARSIDKLVVEMQTANKNAVASNEVGTEIRSMRDTMTGKFDTMSTQITMLSSHLDSSDGKLYSMEQRIAALEGRGAQSMASMPSSSRAPMPTINQSAAGSSNKTMLARSSHLSSRGREASATSASADRQSGAIGNYKLMGASRDTALVQTPTGRIEVKIGSALPDGRIAKGYRKEGDDWILLTNSGEVRS